MLGWTFIWDIFYETKLLLYENASLTNEFYKYHHIPIMFMNLVDKYFSTCTILKSL